MFLDVKTGRGFHDRLSLSTFGIKKPDIRICFPAMLLPQIMIREHCRVFFKFSNRRFNMNKAPHAAAQTLQYQFCFAERW
jgi:hypothetical protein